MRKYIYHIISYVIIIYICVRTYVTFPNTFHFHYSSFAYASNLYLRPHTFIADMHAKCDVLI